MKNFIGLNKEKSAQLAESLNDLLANYQIYYQNLRGFHWNIKGKEFFELHAKFEELYNDARLKIDEIAERILTLGYTPDHTLTKYLQISSIQESQNVKDGETCVRATAENLSVLIHKEREILSAAADAEDEGTVTLMSDYITAQEKVLWMLHAYLA